MATRQMVLTEAQAERLKPEEKRYNVKDSGQPGLDLRVTPSGVKTWSVVYRRGRKTQRITIGRWPAWSVIKARQQARDILRARDLGEDPAAVKQAKKRAPEPPTVQEIGDAWLAAISKRKSLRLDKQALTRDLYPALGGQPLRDVTKPQIAAILDAVLARANARGATGEAMFNRVRASFSSMWAWAIERGHSDDNPVMAIRRQKLQSRERVFTPEEIKTLWAAWDTGTPYSVRMVSRLLLVTAQRLSEVTRAEWSEVDRSTRIWTIPSAHTKSGRVHRLPLSDFALELLDAVEQESSDGRYWFPSKWGRERRGLQALRSNTISRYWSEHADVTWGVEDARPHDLRRSAVTAMAELGVRREVTSAVLNHTHGDVTAVYVRAELIDQQRDALQKWADYLQELVEV